MKSLPDDAGEKWLAAHDSEHDPEDQQREVPWGSAQDISNLVDRSLDPHRIHGPRGRPIVTAETRPCRWCEDMYPPNTAWQKFCSGRCRKAANRATRNVTHSYEE